MILKTASTDAIIATDRRSELREGDIILPGVVFGEWYRIEVVVFVCNPEYAFGGPPDNQVTPRRQVIRAWNLRGP